MVTVVALFIMVTVVALLIMVRAIKCLLYKVNAVLLNHNVKRFNCGKKTGKTVWNA